MAGQNMNYTGVNPTKDFKDKALDKVDNMAESAAETLHTVTDQAGQFANRIAEQGHDVGVKVQEVAGNFQGAVDKSVKDQPMATLAMAAVLGFVLGAIWKS